METMIGGGTNKLPLTLHRRFLHGNCTSRIGLSQVLNAVPISSTANGLRRRHEHAQADRSLSIKKIPHDIGINTSDCYYRLLCRHDRIQWRRNFSSLRMDDGDARVLNQKIISLAELGHIAKAEELLNQMQANAASTRRSELLPDIESYTAMMNAYIDDQRRLVSTIDSETNEIISADNPTMPNEKFGDANDLGASVTIMDLAEKAQNLLLQMEDFSGVTDHHSSMRLSGGTLVDPDLRNASLHPSSYHYDAVISAFANSATASHKFHDSSHLSKQAPFIANRWLLRMEAIADTVRIDGSSVKVSPTVDSYFHVMDAYASGLASRRAPLHIQSIFDKLIQNSYYVRPTVREYRLMLRTWGYSVGHKDAAYKTMGVWMRMLKLFKGGDKEMEPTLEDGKLVLEAWTRSKNNNAARRAQTVLSTMESSYSDKITNVKPDLDCYRHVLTTMSRSRVPDIASNIPRLFKSMDDSHIFPDTACFDLAIETLKNCARLSTIKGDAEMYAKATENMFQRMEKERDRTSATIVTPSAITYTNVIQALVVLRTERAAARAEELLMKMINGHKAGDESMRPTRDSYVGTIHAHGNSGSESKYLHASEIMQRMITDYSEGNDAACPDVQSFHSVIRACISVANTSASIEKKREALMLAISTVHGMKKGLNQPNPTSYLLLLQCCISLLPSGMEREKALRSIFRSCCKDGLVNQKVLGEFQKAVSVDTYHKDVVAHAQSYNGIKSLPETWTRSLGYRVRTHETQDDGVRKRNPIISVSGQVIASTAYSDHRMRRRWSKKNQKYLQGGRM